jgi:hypothetical protein
LPDSSAVDDRAKFSYSHFLSLFRVSLQENSRNVFFIRKFMQTGKIFSRDPYRIMELNVGAWEVQQLPSIKPLFPFLWLIRILDIEVDREGRGLKENRAEQVSVALRVQKIGTHVAHEFVFLHS